MPMMLKYHSILDHLKDRPKKWLITGVAGFIGSNLLETLLQNNQEVVGLDNFTTGTPDNLNSVRKLVSPTAWQRFKFTEGDIRCLTDCENAMEGVDYVLHQAALGSVPRSIENPILTNQSNISGFLNVLHAAKNASVSSFTYAASSSTYGDHAALPKVEDTIGSPLSPYAVTKYVNELYASVYARVYGFQSIGLRYFNVFGPRQSPQGAYAAVIPKWIEAALSGSDININGDGKTSRDFCYIDNVVQMNILAATAAGPARNKIYNVAVGDQTSLTELAYIIKDSLANKGMSSLSKIKYRSFRQGDVRHSKASIQRAVTQLGYDPQFKISAGIDETLDWFLGKGELTK